MTDYTVTRYSKYDYLTDKIEMRQAIADLTLAGYDSATIEQELQAGKAFETDRYVIFMGQIADR